MTVFINHLNRFFLTVFLFSIAYTNVFAWGEPNITSQPQDVSATAGDTVSFNVKVKGWQGSLKFQWFKGNQALSGKNSSTLTISNVSEADQNNYHVVVAKWRKSTTSKVAALTIIGGGDDDNIQQVFTDEAITYSNNSNHTSLIFWQNGNIIATDGDISASNKIYSGTKSFSCSIAAHAIEKGVLESWDERVANTITEWQGDERNAITVRELFNFTSGLKASAGSWGSYKDEPDAYQFAIDQPMLQKTAFKNQGHGIFEYSNINLQVFGLLIKRKLNETALSYLDREIFSKIHLTYADWDHDQADNPFLPFGAHLSAEEWLKYGLFVYHNGSTSENDADRIISADLMSECAKGSKDNPGYGLAFWLNGKQGKGFSNKTPPYFALMDPLSKGGPNGLIYDNGPDIQVIAGANDSRIYIIRSPSLKLIVVRIGGTGGLPNPKWKDAEFISHLLTGKGLD